MTILYPFYTKQMMLNVLKIHNLSHDFMFMSHDPDNEHCPGNDTSGVSTSS